MNTDRLLDYMLKNNPKHEGAGSEGQLIAAAILTHAEIAGETSNETAIAETFGKWLSTIRRLAM